MKIHTIVKNIGWLAVLPIMGVSTAGAVVVYSADFTDTNTFTNGALNGQDGWATSNSGAVIGVTGATVDGFKDHVNGSGATVVSGATYTSTVTFTYTDNSGGVGNGPHFGASIYNGSSADAEEINIMLKRSGNNSYRLGLYTNWGNTNASVGFQQSGTFSGVDIGFVPDANDPMLNDVFSDVLRLSITLTAGADANSWNATGRLFNVTTNTEVQTWNSTPANNLVFAAADGTSIYGGFGGGQSNSNQNIQDRTALEYSFESSVPEPSSLVLVSLGALGFTMRRRRN
ncbi:PEP-CTERM sorting domain-containing protein [Luteolibacter algae]|uniref:PEP-CTERM sorting domain-containing protein n=1 Tax=Luteolibacter algae TaxID=454151 RepID=A0ABW5D4A1_9BACT